MSTVPSARIDRWRLNSAPEHWFFVPEFGLKHNVPDPKSNIHLGGDKLLAGDKLEPYVEAQKLMLCRKYDQPIFAGPQTSVLLADQVDESILLLIRHQPMRGSSVFQVQTYVRIEKWIGIVTLTTTDVYLRQVRPDYERFLAMLTILPEDLDIATQSNPQ